MVDLAAGHVVAIKKFDENCGCKVYLPTCTCICYGLNLLLVQIFFEPV